MYDYCMGLGDVYALFDVDGAEHETHGTIVVLGGLPSCCCGPVQTAVLFQCFAGATTSRNLSKIYSSSLAQTYRVVRLDLPGQGVMHAVSFRFALNRRTFNRVCIPSSTCGGFDRQPIPV